MNQRLTISDLAELLTEYTGKDKKHTELFLREFIAVVSDALPEARMVKVRGLGTFKVIQVEERESVHVNTGERFLIPSHAKFTFTPDKELREQVNKPFASFETTELNDGVLFQAASGEQVWEDEAEAEEGGQGNPVTPVVAEQRIPPVPEESESESPPVPVAPSEEIAGEEKELPRIETGQAGQREERIAEKAAGKPGKSYRLTYILGLFLFLCVAGGLYYFHAGADRQVETSTGAEERSIAGRVDGKKPDPDPDPAFVRGSMADEAPVAEPEKELVVETITPGSRLTLLSLKHYGHKAFWVYIYEHNKAIIRNPNDIKIGTQLVIPDASQYGIDAGDPESVAKAKAKQAELNSEF